MHKDGYKGVGSFENDMYLGMSENSSLRPGTYGKEMNIFLLTSKPLSGFLVGIVGICYVFLIRSG